MWQLLKQITGAGIPGEAMPEPNQEWSAMREQLQADILRILGRAMCIRQVDAGS